MQRLDIEPRGSWWPPPEGAEYGHDEDPDDPFWNERACYKFLSRQVETDIAAASREIEEMCFQVVAEAVASETIMRRLAIPEPMWDYVGDSWRRQEKNLYGRLDLSYDGVGPAKLLEYNADTPATLVESAEMQQVWLQHATRNNVVPPGSSQFNLIDSYLVEAFRNFGIQGPLHLTCVSESADDQAIVLYMANRAEAAGLEAICIDLAEIGIDPEDRFTDFEDNAITTLFKLYPWEFMMHDEFASSIPGCGATFIEPAWRAILSNKGVLALLWQKFEGHDNLVPAWFGDDPRAGDWSGGYVRKPLWSRQGVNVEMVRPGADPLATDGPYGAEGHVIQALHPLPEFDGRHAVTGCWIVASRPCGIAVREDASPITTDDAQFVPHIVLD